MKRTVIRRATAAAVFLALTMSLTAGALAADATVGSDAALQAALADESCEHIYLNYSCTVSGFDIPSPRTVHVVGNNTWNLGAGQVTGNVVVESGAVLCAAASAVSATDGVYVALELTLFGASDGEQVTAVTAEGGPLALYDNTRSVQSGLATVYASKASMDGMGSVTAVTTTGGEYVLAGGSLMRQHRVLYSDMVDAAGSAPRQTSNAATLNAAYFTDADTLALTEPALNGYRFLGWTWQGQSAPQTGDVRIVCAGMSADLSLTAHWALSRQGASGRGGYGSLTALTEESAAEEESAAAPAEAAAATQQTRLPRGSSATRVSFTDGGGADVESPVAETSPKRRIPWAFAALPCALAAGVVLALVLRRKKRG